METTFNKKINWGYLLGVLMLIIGLFVLSGYIYLVSGQRLMAQILYFHTASEGVTNSSKIYVPEIRNIPIDKFSVISAVRNFNQSYLERFITELMLGPQNIYAKDLLPNQVIFDKVIISKNKDIFLYFNSTNNNQERLFQKNKDEIEKWVLFNISQYFPKFKTIILILNKKMLNST